MKALIISVGTGLSQGISSPNSLPDAIVFSLNHHNPDKIIFVVSDQSKKTTLPQVLSKRKTEKFEKIVLSDVDDIKKIYEELTPTFKKIRSNYDQVAVDYTSGTKSMSTALGVLATIFEADTLNCIVGTRDPNVVISGTEQIKTIKPYFATMQQKRKIAIEFFNNNRYYAAINILKEIEQTTKDPQIIDKIYPLVTLAKAYAQWDRFNHSEANDLIKKIKDLKDKLNSNKSFLGHLLSESESETYYIADLLNNAIRRGENEEYADAVARLYRTIEYIGSYQLKTKYKIVTNKVQIEDVPDVLKEKWKLNESDAPFKINLHQIFELLESKNDDLGKKFFEDKKLQDLLSKRNFSILAHGNKPVMKETFDDLLEKINSYCNLVIKDIEKKLCDSKFIQWID